MALAVLTPDTDCNTPCVANTTELCGAGNRLAMYVDTTAPPITQTACLGLGNPFTFDLVAMFVPASPGAPVSAPIELGSIELAAMPEQPSTLVLGVSFFPSLHIVVESNLIAHTCSGKAVKQPPCLQYWWRRVERHSTSPFQFFPHGDLSRALCRRKSILRGVLYQPSSTCGVH